ncbi:carboxypeptidase D isoform X2 [Eurytemora carolleeae]|uniref:carboxypeptidase D isoform X2 n=1 Tax=Eurytemora carolleeae TaxID=1294199 RepID=UPI000C75883B|nr:carboxypeptidase D isoform X2 [Eurytemora carolleeae]|eukprot:XP_023348147.1 carboxypeptidase D-like isoform X2 [Eurytemora affinis]
MVLRFTTHKNDRVSKCCAEFKKPRRGIGKRKKKRKKTQKILEIEYIDPSFIQKYHSHEDMIDALDLLSQKYPSIVKRYSIGRSEEERELAVIQISATGSVKGKRPLLVPMVKYVANIHGDETVGKELLIGLARYLAEGYGQNLRITNLLNTTDIHLVPSLNPDGNFYESRHNINDEDLNRDFPGWRDLGKTRWELLQNRQKESASVIRWVLDNPFVLSLSFHEGRVLVNYPWDDSPAAVEGEKACCPDDAVFSKLSQLYANNHPFMWTGKCLCHSDTFDQGISNGAEWYLVDNGMQDFNYLFSNCLEITVELSCWKKPEEHILNTEWENNVDSLLVLLESACSGVKGIVSGEDGSAMHGVSVSVGKEKDVITSRNGEYWKILTPGRYQIYAFHENQYGRVESVLHVINVFDSIGKSVRCDLMMHLCAKQTFLVNTVKVGFFIDDMKFKDEVLTLFHDTSLISFNVVKEECKNLSDNSRHIVYSVEFTLLPEPLFEFFKERWGEPFVRRPLSDVESKKLNRRIHIYASEKWCGRKEDWSIKLKESI